MSAKWMISFKSAIMLHDITRRTGLQLTHTLYYVIHKYRAYTKYHKNMIINTIRRVPSRPSLPQCMLPFLQDKLRLCTLARLTGAKETRRAARLLSSSDMVARWHKITSRWQVRQRQWSVRSGAWFQIVMNLLIFCIFYFKFSIFLL